MKHCWSCGASVSPSVDWCGQCYASTTERITVAETPFVPSQRSAADERLAAAESLDTLVVIRRSRWARTETTMGPFGRLLASALVLVPIPLCALGGPFAWAGGVLYGGTLLPLAMRDIWKPGRIASGTLPSLATPKRSDVSAVGSSHSPRSGIPAAR